MENPSRVLVADDDESIRHLLCTLVRREKLLADAAADGLEAVEKLKQHEYKVILLDLMMPRLDGFGVIEHLRTHPPSVKPVVLVITAYADQRFKKVDSSIVSGVIRKPFEVSEIGLLVRLCASGVEDPDRIRKMLDSSRDRAVRDFLKAAQLEIEPGGESGHTH